ncbi:MAG: serine/threonine-protein kinase [Gemmatimonadota bacterium]|nr:serine/threonine-protein kinase [Gemmatimonadota bacterium]
MTDSLARLTAALSDRYRIERELGQGGMATVYLAHDIKHDRQVAVKVLRPELAAVIGAERFLAEIRTTANLQHPHILPLFDSGKAVGRSGGLSEGSPAEFLFYIMPFIDGESLRDRLSRDRQLPVDEALRLTAEVAEALDYANERGIVHRDIKPDNILLSRGHALVTDFGIALAVSQAGGTRLTETGLSVGTPDYMSPEQAAGDRELDCRSDVYSLGCLLYEMLSGHPPFLGRTGQEVRARHALDPVPPLRAARATVPDAVEASVQRALSKQPADRFRTAGEFAGALRVGQPSVVRAARHATSGGGRRQKQVLALGALGLLAVGVVWIAPLLRSPQVKASASVIAVVPFTPSAADTGLTRLGRDLVFTVSANLDGVGPIRSVDPHTIMAQLGRQAEDLTRSGAEQLARRLGAGSVLHGSLVRVGTMVRIDLGLFSADSGARLAQIAVVAPPDSIQALTDSITRSVLRQIWQRGAPPTPSLDAALKTRSSEALRALLDGERAMGENRWVDAAAHYERAMAADSTFWLAYWRRLFCHGWIPGEELDSALVQTVRNHRSELPEADRLLVEVGMHLSDSLSQVLAVGLGVTRRFPDNWFGWFDYADDLTHYGPLMGVSAEQTRAAWHKTTELNPTFVPAWDHRLVVAALHHDTLEGAAAIDTLERLSDGPDSAVVQQRARWQFFRMILDEERGRPKSGALLDSVARASVRTNGGSFFPAAFGLADLEDQIDRRFLALGVDAPLRLVIRRRQIAAAVTRGDWDAALAAAEAAVPVLAVETPEFALEPYRIAVVGAWIGGIEPADAARRGATAARAAARLGAGAEMEVVWLDGLLALVRKDRAALAAARAAAARISHPSTAVVDGSLAAFDLALAGREREAGESLAAIQWRQSERGYRDVWELPTALVTSRPLAAQWRLSAGDSVEALRLLVWTDGFYVGQFGRWTSRLRGPIYFERARIEEGLGQADAARRHYELFLRYYDQPVPRLRPMIDEAEAALRRLAGPVDGSRAQAP